MNLKQLSDNELISLHKKKKADVTFILYQRYRNYNHVVVYKTLQKSRYFNALYEESDDFAFDAVVKSIATFNPSKGAYRSYLSFILKNMVVSRIRKFAKDAASDYISVDNQTQDGICYLDTLMFADNSASPSDLINVKENVDIITNATKALKYKRIKNMLVMKEHGYTYKEIAKKYNLSSKAVRSIFYRIKSLIGKDFR